MTQRILKYPFTIQDKFELELPLGAEIMFVDQQKIHEDLTFSESKGLYSAPVYITALWAMVDTEEKRTSKRVFHVVGTGHEFTRKGKNYIGSIMMSEDRLVWHIFEQMII